jgi:hypothetical protein
LNNSHRQDAPDSYRETQRFDLKENVDCNKQHSLLWRQAGICHMEFGIRGLGLGIWVLEFEIWNLKFGIYAKKVTI